MGSVGEGKHEDWWWEERTTSYTCPLTFCDLNLHVPACWRVCRHAHTCTQKLAHTHRHVYTGSHPHRGRCTHAHRHRHTHAQRHVCTHTQTHRHTEMHTCTGGVSRQRETSSKGSEKEDEEFSIIRNFKPGKDIIYNLSLYTPVLFSSL